MNYRFSLFASLAVIARRRSVRSVLGVAVCLAANCQILSAQIITVGPNINVNKATGSQSETSIAISRTNQNIVTLGFNAGSGALWTTSNGGTTWTDRTVSSGLSLNGSYDTWQGADTFGNMYYSYQVNTRTHVARSSNGGVTYTDIYADTANGADHPEMGVGPGVAAGTTSIFLRDSTNSSRILSATSTGLGATGAFTVQTNQGAGNFGSSAVGPGGRHIFAVMNPAGGIGPASIDIRYDATGTNPGGYVSQPSITTQVGGFRPITPQPNRTIDAQIQLQYDHSGGAFNGTLYAVYTQAANTSTNDTNVVFRRSTDNGATFSGELKLNDDTGVNSQFFNRLAVDPVTGFLASVWYDARNSSTNTRAELWGTVSINGGLTWAPNFKISAGISDGRQSNTGDPNEFGDYISMDFYNGVLVTAWADSSNSTGDNPNGTSGLDIYYSRILVAIPEPSSMFVLALLGGGLLQRRRSRIC